MKYKSCKFGQTCRYFHPRKLKNDDQIKEHSYTVHKEEKPSYAQIVTKNLQPQAQGVFSHPIHNTKPQYTVQEPFLGQNSPIQQPFIGQNNHVPQPILGFQDNQKQIMDLLLSLNQRMTNLEKVKMQM